MLLRKVLAILFLIFGLLQVRAQIDENENLPGESSGDGKDLPTDDEDMINDDFSGEGSTKDGDIYDDNIPIGDLEPSDNNGVIPGKEESDPDVGVNLEEGKPDQKKEATGSMSSQFVAALIIGGCVGLLFAICVILLLLYRMRKKDEGSYAIDDEKKAASPYQYTQGQQEYYA